MNDRPAGLADLDITRPGFFLRDDYYDTLAWLRAQAPVHPVGPGTWLVSRYDDIREISRQPELFTSRAGVLVNDPVRTNGPDDASGSLLHLDPPIHADYRKLINREFTPRAAARFEPAIRATTSAIFARLDATAEIDLVEEVAAPIPVLVIAELLGIGDGDRGDFRRWSDAVISVVDAPTDDGAVALGELWGFLTEHVQRRFDAPGDDLLSMLATATVAGQPMTPDQVLMFCLTLLVAGNETTRSLLSGGVDVLAAHPDQRAALAADPARLADAVQECVRWVTPIQAFCRTAVDDIEVAGTAVGAGDVLVLLYASGNRDELIFGATADQFNARRPPAPAHVAFGFGEHLCLGAALARLEARIVLEALLARFPGYEVTGPAEYSPSTLTRSIDRLPVRLQP